jgi:hypothetical protein
MTVNQIQDLVNQVYNQAIGNSEIAANDLTGLIAMGNSVLSSTTNVDAFTNTLLDRIGKTIIQNRAYAPEVLDVVMDTFTFGAIMQKIYVAPIPATEAPQFDLTNGESVDQYVIAKPTVKQKLFTGRNVWQCDVTIPDYQLESAFTSFEEMSAFIDAIFLAVQNSMSAKIEAMARTAYANYIAEKIFYSTTTDASGVHVINLLQNYNTATSSTLTAAQALRDLDFLKYASRQILLFTKRMRTMSELFNTEQYVHHTPGEDLRVTMLADFTTAVDSYLEADTFHNEMVALPHYREVSYWQGSGKSFAYDDVSAVNVITSSGNTVSQTGVVALINDIEAIGMMVDNRRTKSAYNANGEYTNYFNKADMMYFNDMSENGIVFTVADTVFTPAETVQTRTKSTTKA